MRSLLPAGSAHSGEVDLLEAYDPARRHPPAGRPWVFANMVVSLDGATALRGRSSGLSGEADRRVFHLLRSQADVVLVGATTARVERYGPARGDPAPAIAVVTGSLDLDLADRFFTEAVTRPVLVVPAGSDPTRRAAASEVADVIVAGTERVELRAALEVLRRRGHRHVLCEGGPALLGQLVAEDLLDELCLTVSPRLVGGRGSGLLGAAPAAVEPLDLALVGLLEDSGSLFLRYLRPGP